MLHHFRRDRSALHRGRAEADILATKEQHFGKLHNLTGFALDLIDLDDVLGGDPVLLAAGLVDREHGSALVDFRAATGQNNGPCAFTRYGDWGQNCQETGILEQAESAPTWRPRALAKPEKLPI